MTRGTMTTWITARLPNDLYDQLMGEKRRRSSNLTKTVIALFKESLSSEGKIQVQTQTAPLETLETFFDRLSKWRRDFTDVRSRLAIPLPPKAADPVLHAKAIRWRAKADETLTSLDSLILEGTALWETLLHLEPRTLKKVNQEFDSVKKLFDELPQLVRECSEKDQLELVSVYQVFYSVYSRLQKIAVALGIRSF